jgi:phage shock protein C
MAKRLMRSRSEKIIGGVCGGIAEYFDIDPVLVRGIAVVVTLMGGAGILLYLILWAAVPLAPPPPPAAS